MATYHFKTFRIKTALHKVLLHIKSHKKLYFSILILLIIFYFSLPKNLFPQNYSTVILDCDGELLGARISSDGQWRFPEDSLVPNKFKQSILQFEDKHFYQHPGFNPVSLCRALWMNIKAGKIVSGGSTLTMQVIRLHRENKKRSVLEKLIEIVLATRLELRLTKAQILALYASHAPFGGNVVGINAASWRYFGRGPENISWAEAALLAVLPNSPAMIHPGRNRDNLIKKRNKLLIKLFKARIIDRETYQLSLLEPIPLSPLSLPDITPHLTENYKKKFPGKIIHSSVKKPVQENVIRLVTDYYKQLKANEIYNASVLILEVSTGNILAYIGNTPSENQKIDGQDVDCIQASRSTGSILKPLLYMAMQQEGDILPGTLIPDIPTRMVGFQPENYDLSYDGVVPAKRALARSLNVPAVRMLQSYGIPKFQNLLQKLGMNTLVFSPDHYGLTLIVGGAEGNLWDITNIYARLAGELRTAHPKPRLIKERGAHVYCSSPFSGNNPDSLAMFLREGWKGSIYLTFDALLEVNRPDEEAGWSKLSSSHKIAWKTGTSYGFRDAWAIGTTPEYVVGVWVGNADGEGRPGLTGIGAAAPLLFQVFNSLPATSWFQKPYDDFEKIPVCRLSGYRAGPYCQETDSVYVAIAGTKTKLCPYHVLVHLSPDRKYRVSNKCMEVDKILNESWFVLPPAMEWYYRKKNVFYKRLPSVMKGCADDQGLAPMELIYPTEVLKIFVPREIDGSPGKTVFEMAHRNPGAILYWHLDDEYIGTTKDIHQVALNPSVGKHGLTVVDNEGFSLTRWFEVVDKK
jgi:penicillin-binding protein 1C